MAWIWMVLAAGAVLLWAISLGRVLSSAAPSCVPSTPQFMPPLSGDRRSRNVLLVVAHPDDESMYVSSPCGLNAQLPCLWNASRLLSSGLLV
jgi:N-acetylglucosaminylphosphatidylinositol deacetylase